MAKVLFDKRFDARPESGSDAQTYSGSAGTYTVPPADYLQFFTGDCKIVIPAGTLDRLVFLKPGMCAKLGPANDGSVRFALIVDPAEGGYPLLEGFPKGGGAPYLYFHDPAFGPVLADRLDITGLGGKLMIELTPVEQEGDVIAYAILGCERFSY